MPAGKDKEREMQMYQEKQEKAPHITAWRAYGQKIFTTPASRRIGYGLTGIMCLLGIQCLFLWTSYMACSPG